MAGNVSWSVTLALVSVSVPVAVELVHGLGQLAKDRVCGIIVRVLCVKSSVGSLDSLEGTASTMSGCTGWKAWKEFELEVETESESGPLSVANDHVHLFGFVGLALHVLGIVAVSITSFTLDAFVVTEGADHLVIGDKVDFTIGAVNVQVQIEDLYWVLAVTFDSVDAGLAGAQLARIAEGRVLADVSSD